MDKRPLGHDPFSIRSLVWDELERFGLIPSPDRYRAGLAFVAEFGEEDRNRIRAMVGERTWREATRSLPRPLRNADCDRILGFGRLLTEFSAAPVGLSAGVEVRVARLGALANFIVTVYDQFVDLGQETAAVLPRWVVEAAPTGSRPLSLQFRARFGRPPVRFLTRLVVSYFGELRQLQGSQQKQQEVDELLQVILTMYEAEVATIHGAPDHASARVLRRKSTLPFIVMGLPAWSVAAVNDDVTYRWHLSWLGRLGSFVGWIDDVVDLDDDLRARHPNRAGIACERRGPNADRALAAAIGERGRRLLDEWRVHVAFPSSLKKEVADALPITLYSWFGEVRNPC
jgi:hypothetical protein